MDIAHICDFSYSWKVLEQNICGRGGVSAMLISKLCFFSFISLPFSQTRMGQKPFSVFAAISLVQLWVIEVAAVWHRQNKSPYSELRWIYSLPCTGYSGGQLACLFQFRTGLGCSFYISFCVSIHKLCFCFKEVTLIYFLECLKL